MSSSYRVDYHSAEKVHCCACQVRVKYEASYQFHLLKEIPAKTLSPSLLCSVCPLGQKLSGILESPLTIAGGLPFISSSSWCSLIPEFQMSFSLALPLCVGCVLHPGDQTRYSGNTEHCLSDHYFSHNSPSPTEKF